MTALLLLFVDRACSFVVDLADRFSSLFLASPAKISFLFFLLLIFTVSVFISFCRFFPLCTYGFTFCVAFPFVLVLLFKDLFNKFAWTSKRRVTNMFCSKFVFLNIYSCCAYICTEIRQINCHTLDFQIKASLVACITSHYMIVY